MRHVMNGERIKLLQSMAVFGGISEPALRFLIERSSIRTRALGDVFFHEDDEAHSMFILLEGVVNIIKHWKGKAYTLEQRVAGDTFGEVALMELMPRCATVEAAQDCVALELPRTALYELYKENIEAFTLIQMNLGREVCRRLRQADQRLFEARHDTSLLETERPYRAIS